MPLEVWAIIGTFIFGILFSIIGWLFSRQLSELISQNKDLYAKHEVDVAKLNMLELKLSEEYHKRSAVDDLFSMMRATMKEGFDGLKEDLRALRQNGNSH